MILEVNANEIQTQRNKKTCQHQSKVKYKITNDLRDLITTIFTKWDVDTPWLKSKGALKKEELLNTIENFKSLNLNWDGCGGEPLEEKSAENAKGFLSNLKEDYVQKITSFFPTPNGTLAIIWENKFTKGIASLEIGNDDFSYYFKTENNMNTIPLSGKILTSEIISQIEGHIQKLIK